MFFLLFVSSSPLISFCSFRVRRGKKREEEGRRKKEKGKMSGH